MTKTNDSGVPFLSGTRVSTQKYKDNYNKIDWNSKKKEVEVAPGKATELPKVTDYTEYLEELLRKCLPYVEADANLFTDSKQLLGDLNEVLK